jgi:hypothetical protein
MTAPSSNIIPAALVGPPTVRVISVRPMAKWSLRALVAIKLVRAAVAIDAEHPR